jgi:hypothetical protein
MAARGVSRRSRSSPLPLPPELVAGVAMTDPIEPITMDLLELSWRGHAVVADSA